MINHFIQSPCSSAIRPIACCDFLLPVSAEPSKNSANVVMVRHQFLSACCRHTRCSVAASSQRFRQASRSAIPMSCDDLALLQRATRQTGSRRERPMYAGQPNWVSDRDRADVTLRSAGAEETVADVFDVMANMSNPALFAASEAISLYERRENTALAKDTKDAILIAAGFIDVVTLLIPYVGFVKALGAFAKLSAMVLRNQASSIAERLPGAVVHQIIENRLAAVAPYWDVSLEVMPDVMPDAIADATLDGTLTTTRIPAMERGVAPSAWRANGMSESRESSQERAFEASKRRQRGSHTDRRG